MKRKGGPDYDWSVWKPYTHRPVVDFCASCIDTLFKCSIGLDVEDVPLYSFDH
jgi:hypothetical protein